MPDSQPTQTGTHSLVIPCPHCDTLNRVPSVRLSERPNCGHCHKPLFIGEPLALDKHRFERHAQADLPLLVDFWASWCGPCRIMAPIFEAAAKELEPRVRFAKVDTEADPELAGRYQIRAIPTMILFRGGRELARRSGALPASELRRWIEQSIAT